MIKAVKVFRTPKCSLWCFYNNSNNNNRINKSNNCSINSSQLIWFKPNEQTFQSMKKNWENQANSINLLQSESFSCVDNNLIWLLQNGLIKVLIEGYYIRQKNKTNTGFPCYSRGVRSRWIWIREYQNGQFRPNLG